METTKTNRTIDCNSGDPMLPVEAGIHDNFRVKRQSIYLSNVLDTQLLLVDEVTKAGKQIGKTKADNMGLDYEVLD